MTEAELRTDLVARAQGLDASGLNRGASGNLSVRCGDRMLITPSAVPYPQLTADMIAAMPLSGDYGAWEGPLKPSTEWRFHLDLMRARPDIGAVVHTHAPWCTVLAIARKPIPAVHYMIAAFGGVEIPVCDYACYGTAELSAHVVSAMEGRAGCLMANHGMLTAADTLNRACWLAHEMEALAHQHYHSLLIGGGHILSEIEISDAARGFASNGVQDSP